MNAINIIAPYKWHGMWVFDDPRVGLVQEPFVAGADTMIDRVVADIPDAEHGFTLIFSSTPFPGHQYRLDWRRAGEAATGTMLISWTWKAGSAPPCFGTFRMRRSNYTFKRRAECCPLVSNSPANSADESRSRGAAHPSSRPSWSDRSVAKRSS